MAMSQLPRRYRLLLLFSLALNLGLGTAMLGMHWKGRDGHAASEDRRWARVPDPRALSRILDEPDRKILREVMGIHRQGMRESFGPLGAARREMSAVLGADPFDPDAADAALASVRANETVTAQAMHRFLLDLAPRLSVQGRHRIAATLERRHDRRRDRRDRARDADETADETTSVAPQVQ